MIGVDEGDKPGFGLKEGEDVKCMILSIDYSPQHKKVIDHENAQLRERNQALMVDHVDLPYSYKAGGMAVKFAVVNRAGEKTIIEKTELDGTVTAELPNYPISTNFTHHGFIMLLDTLASLVSQGKKVYSMQEKGLGSNLKNGKLQVIDLHPRCGTACDPAVETNRKTRWADIERLWRNLTEDQAKAELLAGISRRLGLFIHNGNSVQFVDPEVGMTFNGIIKRNGKYWDARIFNWNGELKQYDVYAKGTTKPTEQQAELAKAIDHALEVARLAFKMKQAELTIVKEDAEDDEPPF